MEHLAIYVLVVVRESTHYSSESWKENISSKEINEVNDVKEHFVTVC